MLERNAEAVKEMDKLEKRRYRGQIICHFVDGVIKLIDWPRKPVRKEIANTTLTTESSK